ncbi:hypothetical protein GLAREA_02271 [Glarea lozoyensis ATCC 20868]|uniref:Uncharacterized protein n=1 Tax=Glarea lozoyensis (strain ATCC 20868 / MF5171) TaxID=1116229 RepID=S3CMD1_GLAL2|nr:uncharacterized protein GLAREA_02271 [Glarea lozoyensis ATCC 20868]EPE26359.1 hypothetical protein GLAREA_02271 [Glarea lozoyensis ATCC 20868]
MGRKVEKEEDNWYGVIDPKRRKQIQDRLAQRARRRRLAEQAAQKNDPETTDEISSVTVSRKKDVKKRTRPEKDSNTKNTTSSKPQLTSLTTTKATPLPRDDIHLHPPTLTIYSALFHNGSYLNLTCSTSYALSPTPPSFPHTPPSLRPTSTQLSTAHYRWIDRFPIPKLRDRMITWAAVFNAEEFLADLFDGVGGGSLVIRERGEELCGGGLGG